MSPKPNVSEERKEQIAEAATKVFVSKGFDKARMNDIAEEAGLSKGALYLYFKSKDAIITHLLDKLFEREFADLLLLKDDPRPASEKLLFFTEEMIAGMQNWTKIIPIMYEFLGRLFRQSIVQEAFKKYMRFYLELITPIIQEGIDDGEFKADNAEDVAITIGAIFEGTILLWVYDSEIIDLEKHLNSAMKLLLEGLKA
ncbi:MAG: TetR/AcrR family transcriptional regulator [Anaerolineae bacterium]|jgi:AcrR family transcriptional regulator|nr:TetR/AcrR family transcriptional regulator [Anaerolineae bacterium]MBT3712929.1 TetR/AcrR family transcriptional regulator [Anaerolineae bacterium]MBT4309974.1 TetR/AcrR family transcriptional regulator [Anaerolineae bacterium]MBT4457040.1 TetR/AcrR family transcriptional regulator [Anaerolineae bacterium]MBT6059717.1 TetR/AcrR family transcriptional regulator [Anaerolineae bacterium]